MYGILCPPSPCPGAAALWRAAGRHSAEAAGAPRPHNLCCVACTRCAALLAELVLCCLQKQRVRQACRCCAGLLDIALACRAPRGWPSANACLQATAPLCPSMSCHVTPLLPCSPPHLPLQYAAWRAAEINKAVKEGRPPAPPPSATSAEMDEEAAMLEELAKLETGGSSSSGSLPAAPSGLASAAGAGTSAAAAAPPPLPPAAPLPPPPPSAAASTRLSGLPPALDEDSDWAPPGQPAPGSAPPPPAMPPPPPFDAAAGAPPAGSSEAGDGHHFELPSPPKQRPIETQHSHGAWVPPPPRRFQTFQKARWVHAVVMLWSCWVCAVLVLRALLVVCHQPSLRMAARPYCLH